jgi:hypothetical protein
MYFQTKNPNLGKFWKVFLWPFCLLYGQMLYLIAIWHIIPVLHDVLRKIWHPWSQDWFTRAKGGKY